MKIPRKNISKRIMDVRRSSDLRAAETAKADVPAAEERRASRVYGQEFYEKERLFPWKSAIATVIILAIFGGGFYFFSAYKSKTDMVRQAEQGLKDSGFAERFGLSGDGLNIRSFSDLNNKIFPLLKSGFGAYKGLAQMTAAWIRLTQDAESFKNNFIAGFNSGSGEDLVGPLKKMKDDLSSLNQAADSVDASSGGLKDILGIHPADYLALKYQGKFWERGLASIADWLSSDRTAIIFFQNSSELRPTGGFWGSLAEINFRGGRLDGITVRDINEIDRTLQSKTVPPKPLHALVANWRTADSNWFFNFADSASKAAEFSDSSKLFADAGKRADLIGAVSPKVISDILSAVGPVYVSSTKAAIDANNFLPSIQAEVQKGHDAGSREAKGVLKELYAALIPRLSELSGPAQDKLLEAVLSRVSSKDMIFWAADENLESLFAGQGADGAVFEIPQRFNGDYLGIAAANIGGAKSDYVIKQTVILESQLTLDGSVQNHLEVARRDNAKKTDSWWYTAPNQSYTRVYLSPGGKLQGAKGGFLKSVRAPVNYKSAGYAIDPAVEAIESTAEVPDKFPWLTLYKEAGKTVLGAWQKVSPGATSTLTYDYSHRLFLGPDDGVAYEFVLDKQPGVSASYRLSFSAPVGFVWKENNSPVYEYLANDIPSRLTIKLTLARAS